MRKLLLATTALLALSSMARADVVEDPLLGFCTGCTHVNIGGNDVTLLGANGVTNFGFNSAPNNSGDLVLKFLIPNSFTLTQVQNFAGSVSVTGTSSSAMTLVSPTPWTSGFLESNYLGITSFAAGAPPNPLAAWLGATQTLDPTATGYYVLLADMGNYNLNTPGQGNSPDLFSLNPAFYAQGGFIVADLFTGPNHTLDVTTAQSGALFFNGPNGTPFSVPPVPEISTWAMMLLGFLGVGLVGMRRRDGSRSFRMISA
jgi:hypothetical protein